MKDRVKTLIAFALLAAVLTVSAVLTLTECTGDVYPGEQTQIMLYGEAHGFEEYYEREFGLWQGCYREGCRDLFVELPYYSAEFLNLWMREDGDESLDRLFEEIRGTLTANSYFYEFLHRIKADCPETVFHGTDVGHQYATTGARYLQYLEDNGLADSENYALARECIRQGEEYAAVHSADGISPVREQYMVANFIDTYARVGGRIMGIYGSYHTDLNDPNVMAGRLKQQYGDLMSSVKLSTLATEDRRYSFGFCVTGLVFLLMLFVPNIIWGLRRKPEGYAEAAKNENKVLLAFERVGEVAVTVTLLIFRDFDPCVRLLPEGLFMKPRLIIWAAAFVLMILYECYWIRYFRSPGTMRDLYSSFAGFPVAGATLPVIAVLLLGIYALNLILIGAAIVLGIGHIGIHLMHRREACGAE